MCERLVRQSLLQSGQRAVEPVLVRVTASTSGRKRCPWQVSQATVTGAWHDIGPPPADPSVIITSTWTGAEAVISHGVWKARFGGDQETGVAHHRRSCHAGSPAPR